MKPDCVHCSRSLLLVVGDGPNYSWRCEGGCAEGIDTGVSTSSSIEFFQRGVVRDGRVDLAQLLRPPLRPEYVSGVRVYMPQLLYHFIECTWGACYNYLYLYCIAPYLDAPEVVDYVLRTPVVRASPGTRRGSTGAHLYGELHERLRQVSCPKIDDYLRRTFDEHSVPRPNGVHE
jgi:hypothetical protein